MEIAIVVLIGLTLIAAVAVPIILYQRLLNRVRSETSQLISRLDKNLAASVKLIEVRDYYDETSAALKEMLDQAYKEGNRQRQDDIRKLVNRLETLKIRAVDKQVSILTPDGGNSRRKKRRRRSSRRRKSKSSNASKSTGKSDDQSKGKSEK